VLRTELTDDGRPTSAALVRPDRGGDADAKVFGRYLTPYLQARLAPTLAA
jgi:hypothetical protein